MAQIPKTLKKNRKRKPLHSKRSGREGKQFSLFSIPEKSIYEFTRYLSVMIRARIPLLEALEVSGDQTDHHRMRQIVKEITREVKNGKSFASALAKHPQTFDPLYIHLVETGEEAGILGEILGRLAEYMEKRGSLKKKIQKALAYPVFIIGVTILVLVFLLTVIVPTFAEMYADYDAQLPAATSYIIWASNFITGHLIWLIPGFIVSIFICKKLLQRPSIAALKDSFILNIPVMGAFYRKSIITRFCQTLGTLLKNGIGLLHALEISRKSTRNTQVKASIKRMSMAVRQGSSLAKSMIKTGLFPPVIAQMITVGEETAELSSMLLHIAETHQQELDADLDILTSVLEPAMIVVIGLVIGVVIVAMYLPVFEMMNVIQ
ncbi:MAG: type II secretion system F family protein [Balneolaceae bacterium]|nr:MAG: type II secretion system F family protein [Balneolaceae bacterium]